MYSVLVASHSYPLNLAPFKAKFIQDQVLLFKESQKFKLEVLHLTPKTIPFTQRWKQLEAGYKTYGEKINKQTYLSIPRRKFPTFIQANISTGALSFLNENPFNLIHLHWLFPGGLAAKRLKKAGFKIVLTIHGSDWYQSIANPKLKVQVLEALDYVDLVLFSGPQLKDDVLKLVPDLRKKSKLVYNFIDTNFYRLPSLREKLEKKTELKFNKNKINVLTVASLRPEKGIDILIESLRKTDLNNIHFHVVGLIENTVFARTLLNRVKELELEPFITFHGLKTPIEVLDYYFASDLYLLPSRREGFNLSILESTATGLPVLCTNVGGNSSVVKQSIGKVVAPESVDALAASIKYMTEQIESFDPVYISKQTSKTYSPESMLARLDNIYSDVISL